MHDSFGRECDLTESPDVLYTIKLWKRELNITSTTKSDIAFRETGSGDGEGFDPTREGRRLGAARAQARRLIGGWTLEDMAREFSVSRRTAGPMRDTVRDLFPSFDYIQDGLQLRFVIRGGLALFFIASTAVELAELDGQIRAPGQAGHKQRAEVLRRLATR